MGTGNGVVLLSEGNATLCSRPQIVTVRITSPSPGELTIVRRRGDDPHMVRDFVEALREDRETDHPPFFLEGGTGQGDARRPGRLPGPPVHLPGPRQALRPPVLHTGVVRFLYTFVPAFTPN